MVMVLHAPSLAFYNFVNTTAYHFGRQPWARGYGRGLMFWRSWVQILAPYTGWTFFSHLCVAKFYCLLKTKINEKEAVDGQIFNNSLPLWPIRVFTSLYKRALSLDCFSSKYSAKRYSTKWHDHFTCGFLLLRSFAVKSWTCKCCRRVWYGEPGSFWSRYSTARRKAGIINAEIKHSDWLFQVPWLF